MAPSFDRAVACLLCPEDNISLMGFDDDDDEEVADRSRSHRNTLNDQEWFWGGYMSGSSAQIEDCFRVVIGRECEHLPRDDYQERLKSGLLDFSLRGEAVNWIEKVCASYSFGPLCLYLCVNYLDRFLSMFELPQGKSWMMQLLSVACLSVAAKMEETEVPLPLDLQVGEAKFVFEARTIQRMELLVLSTLKWKMRAVTPFSFLDFFLKKLHDDHPPPRGAISRAVELILSTIRDIEFLEFKPSEIAAAVALSVFGETNTVNFGLADSSFEHVQKGRVLSCYEVINKLGLVKKSGGCSRTSSAVSIPGSPVGVLDAGTCLSYKSEEVTVASCPNSHLSPSPKRRRLSRLSVPS